MAVGVIIGIFTHSEFVIPEIWNNFSNMHPDGAPIWSVMFITVACGAISGIPFYTVTAMARCMKQSVRDILYFMELWWRKV